MKVVKTLSSWGMLDLPQCWPRHFQIAYRAPNPDLPPQSETDCETMASETCGQIQNKVAIHSWPCNVAIKSLTRQRWNWNFIICTSTKMICSNFSVTCVYIDEANSQPRHRIRPQAMAAHSWPSQLGAVTTQWPSCQRKSTSRIGDGEEWGKVRIHQSHISLQVLKWSLESQHVSDNPSPSAKKIHRVAQERSLGSRFCNVASQIGAAS